jgi:hypothetical protein
LIDIKDQTYCPKCHRMFCEGYWLEGVCIVDMQFCGEPTADGDQAASYLRVYYEAHRESYWDRSELNCNGRQWEYAADNFMLGLMNEMHRINCERQRQTKINTNIPNNQGIPEADFSIWIRSWEDTFTAAGRSIQECHNWLIKRIENLK